MSQTAEIQPVFDPAHVGASLDIIGAQIPVTAPWLQGSVVGDTLSRRKGDGYDVNGINAYEVGDNPRHIDQRITARQPDGWPQVRNHYRDITPSMWIVSDVFEKRNANNPGHFSEQRLALSAIMGLMRIAEVQGMPSAVIASGDHRLLLAQDTSRNGRKHTFDTASLLAKAIDKNEIAGDDETEYRLADLLHFAGSKASESVVAVVSDFRDVRSPYDKAHGWSHPLRQLCQQGNQLLAVETTNPWDFRLPDMVDRFTLKRGALYIGNNKLGKQQRNLYELSAGLQQIAIDEALAAVGSHHVKLSTDDKRWKDTFVSQLRARKQRKA